MYRINFSVGCTGWVSLAGWLVPNQAHEAPRVSWQTGWLELGGHLPGILRTHGLGIVRSGVSTECGGLRTMAPVAAWWSTWLGLVQTLAKVAQGALW